MTDPSTGTTPSPEAERIAAEGTDVRERIRKLIVDLADRRGMTADELRRHARDILDGAKRGLAAPAPASTTTASTDQKKAGVLNDVVDGLADGFSRAAYATKLAIEEAESRRQRFADEDLRTAMDNLRQLQSMFIDTVKDFARGLSTSVRTEAGDLGAHAARAAESMNAPIQDALNAAAKHPGRFAAESATAGAAVARRAVGTLFQAAGGLLQGAGEVISGKPRPTGRDPGATGEA